MNGFDRAIAFLKERRQRIIEGKTNCIPSPFKRFSLWFPGWEKARYAIITASQKVGKSKLADYMCIYHPLFYAKQHPNKLKFKILYFTLEMSTDEKRFEFMCHLLYKLDGIRIGTTDLKSTNADYPISEEYLNKFTTPKYKEYMDFFEETVTFIDDVKNPTGINKLCRDYALSRGTVFKKKIKVKNDLGQDYFKEVVDRFEWNDPDCYYIIILDNYSNLLSESGMNKRETIEKMSKYFITLRDQLKYTIVAIQHQAQDKEGLESIKYERLYPTSDGLADCKMTVRDIDVLLGLYSPFKYGINEHNKYDITAFRNNIRFLQILEDRNNGGGGQTCPLFFDGAVSYFNELPLPNDREEINKVLAYINTRIRKKTAPIYAFFERIITNKFFRNA